MKYLGVGISVVARSITVNKGLSSKRLKSTTKFGSNASAENFATFRRVDDFPLSGNMSLERNADIRMRLSGWGGVGGVKGVYLVQGEVRAEAE